MRHNVRATGAPVATHTSLHLLVGAHALPAVHTYPRTVSGPAGDTTVYLQGKAEHRTFSFDHTSSFTISGPKAAFRQLLERCQQALDQLPADDERTEGR
jgi:hypothetical protein